jgi:hypothetical protein
MRALGGRIGTACLLLVVGAGCGASEPSPEPDPGPVVPVVNEAVTLTAPEGSHVERCWFPGRTPKRGRIVAVVVPDSLHPGESEDEVCRFASLTTPWSHAMAISVGVDEGLERYRVRYVDRYLSEDGDDATANVDHDDAATIFDGRRGGLLAFDAFNDGEQRHTVIAQFEDVRVSWSVPTEGFPDATYDDTEITDGIAGVQIVEDARRPR